MEKINLPSPEKIKPKFHAEECPVCNGFGSLKNGTKVCQGCSGKGYVLVPNDLDTWRRVKDA